MLSKLTWQGVVMFGIILTASVALAFLDMPNAVEALIAFVTGSAALGTILFKSDDDPPPPRSPVGIVSRSLSVLLVVACCARLLVACSGPPKPAEYAAELALCSETSSRCADYVACRSKVAAKYGRPFSGSCADGGAP